MPRVQTALLTAILVVLCVIGWQLNRIAGSLSPVGSVMGSLLGSPHAASETRAERNKRLEAETREAVDDAKAVMGASVRDTLRPPRGKPAPAQ